ncbi:ABC transporter substrate-binding protein [Lactobacillus delbrueckii]|uniref:ABC transporter substrate-binding protein n=1 Tax=Lactobacillus delbrueckii TaxID=1584 RepID=UPI002AB0B70B|nr:ABC transporter substrate-binding protein [Lactobacillus delbrueckii]MEE0190232.1 ABC transporter substrate-binding protein [Lactobacillus delbrueckii]
MDQHQRKVDCRQESINPYYYAKSAVKLQKLNYQVVKDSNTAHQLFQQGSLDDAVVSGTTAQGLQNNKNLYYIYRSGNNFVNLNMAKGAVLANKQLRQALYLAVNRTQLSKKVLADGSLHLLSTKCRKGSSQWHGLRNSSAAKRNLQCCQG